MKTLRGLRVLIITKSPLLTHFMQLGYLYTLKEVSFPNPKLSNSLTHLEAQGGPFSLVIHLFLDLQKVREVQEILVAQFLGVQENHYDLFLQEALGIPFHLGIPVQHHPRIKAQFRDLSGESANKKKEVTSVTNTFWGVKVLYHSIKSSEFR